MTIAIFPVADGMFVCQRGSNGEGLVSNVVTGIELPSLSRAYVTSHYVCGNILPNNGAEPQDCSISFGIADPNQDNETLIFSEVSSENIINNGSLEQIREWFYESIPLPNLNGGERLRILATFDTDYGGFGLDNVRISTPAMYVYD